MELENEERGTTIIFTLSSPTVTLVLLISSPPTTLPCAINTAFMMGNLGSVFDAKSGGISCLSSLAYFIPSYASCSLRKIKKQTGSWEEREDVCGATAGNRRLSFKRPSDEFKFHFEPPTPLCDARPSRKALFNSSFLKSCF